MRAARGTRTPSVSATLPSTFTHPFSIHSSASRREHRPSSLMRFERRGSSVFSCFAADFGAGAGVGGATRCLLTCAGRARDVGALGATVSSAFFGSLRVIRAIDHCPTSRNATVTPSGEFGLQLLEAFHQLGWRLVGELALDHLGVERHLLAPLFCRDLRRGVELLGTE